MNLRYWNVIEIRLRGDGRRYHFNLQIDETFEETSEDMYFHPIFTRGGPYWEVIQVQLQLVGMGSLRFLVRFVLQIPFSHLVTTNKGKIVEFTSECDRTRVRHIGFSLVEGFEGPFKLEVDYIKVLTDDSHKQACAYECIDANHGVDLGSKFGKI